MIRTFLCSFCMVFAFTAASAEIPRIFTLQCTLTDRQSNPLPDGIHRITVRLYDAPSGGMLLYGEEFTQSISKGLFHCTIGEKSPLPTNVDFTAQYYIGISYDGSPEAENRIALHPAPYALMAAQVPDGSITSDKLSPALLESIKGEKSLANSVSGTKAFVGGGDYNTISNVNYASIVAGNGNSITSGSTYASIGGGYSNAITGNSATISGGNDNSANAQYTVIGGGYSNYASGYSSVISGGNDNTNSGQNGTIGGGYSNTLSGNSATIAGGNDNAANAQYSAIAGGYGLSFSSSATGSFGYNGYVAGATATVTAANTAYFGNVHLWLGNTRGQAGELRLYEAQSTTGTFPAASTNYTAFTSGAQSVDITYTLPPTAGENGQFLQTNGTGVLTWGDAPGGSEAAGGDLSGSYPNPTIADGAITVQKLAAGVLPTSLPPSGNAGGDLSGNYPNPTIADGAITTQKLAAGVLPTTLPPSGAASGDLSGNYPSPTLASSSVTSAKIADSTIMNSDISPTASIAYSKLNIANSILSSDLASNSVTGPKISAEAVTTSKIADLTIQSNDLKDNAIITAKIADTNVTMAKIAKSGATSGQVIGWNGSAWTPTNTHQSSSAATVPALQIGTSSSATGYVTFASKLTQNSISGGSTLAAGSSVYELTGTAPASAITLPTGVPAGTSLYLLNSTTGSVVVVIVNGSYTVSQYRGMQFLYSGSAWYPLGN